MPEPDIKLDLDSMSEPADAGRMPDHLRGRLRSRRISRRTNAGAAGALVLAIGVLSTLVVVRPGSHSVPLPEAELAKYVLRIDDPMLAGLDAPPSLSPPEADEVWTVGSYLSGRWPEGL